MPVLKPVRGIRLNKSHPLARGLVGYWLLNEGSGNKVFDLSGNGLDGSATTTVWTAGRFGSCLDFPGSTNNTVIIPNSPLFIFPDSFTILMWHKPNNPSADTRIQLYDGASTDGWALQQTMTSGSAWRFVVWVNGVAGYARSDSAPTGEWQQAVGVREDNGTILLYVDGVRQADTGSRTGVINSTGNLNIGSDYNNTGNYFNGLFSHAMIYNRALSASEIALLYREPFCMFEAWRTLKTGGQIVELAGTAAGTSGVTAVLSSIRGLTASTGGFTAVDGSLGIMGESPPEMESTVRHPVESWLREALFNGMTANAFKLGTSLSLGWFWVRVTGCSVLYRGSAGGGMGEIDFANILAVSGQNASQISPPSYISHNNGSTYFYVVRRFNNCGYQEHTLAAAVKVVFDGSSGELAEPQPNNISSSKVEQVASNKIRLTWFYCPLEQGSRPVSFNIYYDDRTGQIDYENPLFSSGYKGRKFYSFQSNALEAGGYLFAIRAEDAGGIENISLARLKIQLDTLNPDAIDILRAEAV